jgi:carbonic anhydrase
MNCKDIQKFTIVVLVFLVIGAESTISSGTPVIDCLELILRALQNENGTTLNKFSYYSYDPNGPQNWGYSCNSGQRQSPIAYDQVRPISASSSDRLRMIGPINTKPTKVHVINSGYGATYSFQYADAAVPQITGGPLGSDIYNFHSFHFHYPCEHMPIKFQLICRLEVHYVHFNAKYESIANAINQPDGLAVLGVMYATGFRNDHSFPYIPLLSNVLYYHQEIDVTTNTFSYADAIGFTTIPKIVSYKGSLTTPKCCKYFFIILESLLDFTSFYHDPQLNPSLGSLSIDCTKFLLEIC